MYVMRPHYKLNNSRSNFTTAIAFLLLKVDYQDKDRPSPLLRKRTTVGVGETIVDLHRNSEIHKR